MAQRIPCSNCQRKFNCPRYRIVRGNPCCSKSCAARFRFKNRTLTPEDVMQAKAKMEKHKQDTVTIDSASSPIFRNPEGPGALIIDVFKKDGHINTVFIADDRNNAIRIEVTDDVNLGIKES